MNSTIKVSYCALIVAKYYLRNTAPVVLRASFGANCITCVRSSILFNVPVRVKTYQSHQYYGKDVTIQKYLNKNNVEQALVFVKDERTYRVYYPFNAPFAKPHIYAKDRENENRKLAEKFPGYRYFIADEKNIVEVSMDEL